MSIFKATVGMKNIGECQKKTVFEFDYSADFLFVLSHIEFLK